MRCEHVKNEMKALLDDELGRLQAWQARQHIASCAKCAEDWADLKELNNLVLRADFFERNDPIAIAKRSGASPVLRPRFALAAVALAAAALLIILPTWVHRPRSMAEAVADAIGRANTWHLSGWKQIDGKHVPWDIWGRRKPFFFYEKVGDSVTIDNGQERVLVFSPNPALNRPRGLVIHVASHANPSSLREALAAAMEPSVENMVGDWDWRGGGGLYMQKPFRQTPDRAFFRRQWNPYFPGVNTNLVFTVDKHSWLPVQYQLHYQSKTREWDTEHLTARYDADLPNAVLAPSVPAHYQILDLTKPSARAVDLKAIPAAMDRDGNILMRFQARLGGMLLDADNPLSTTIDTLNQQGSLYGVRDGKKSQYLNNAFSPSTYPDRKGYVYALYLPLSVGHAPTAMHMAVDVAPNVQVRGTDDQPESGPPIPEQSTIPLFQATVPVDLDLTHTPATQNLVAGMPPDLAQTFLHHSLPEQIAQTHVGYYLTSLDYQKSVVQRYAPDLVSRGVLNANGVANLARPVDIARLTWLYTRHKSDLQAAKIAQEKQAIYWQKRLIEATPNKGNEKWIRLQNMLSLAEIYNRAGDQAGMRATLTQLISECQPMPEHGGLLRRQAEYASKSGQFPWYAGYKGPSLAD